MNPQINIIAAVCTNGAIGRGGDLLFHISEDLRRFKSLTMGCPIIMGRKTFESFPKGPLPGRRNIVVSRTAGYSPAGAEVFASPAEALAACAGVEKVFIIGGGEIYRTMLPEADTLMLTQIDAAPADADTFFPPVDGFEEVESGEWLGESPRYRFVTLRRRYS